MRLDFKRKTAPKVVARLKKRVRIRKGITGTNERPRLSVFRSANNIYAQIVSDVDGRTLVEASTKTVTSKGRPLDVAKSIGQEIAKRAQAKNIKAVVFDRSGYLYHGRVKAVADGAREGGLQF